MDKKEILRNFKNNMYSKFGKNAEGAINNKIYQLLREPELGESQLKAAEKDIGIDLFDV